LPREHHGKGQTAALPIEEFSAPKIISIPCAQHIGAPAVPIVQVGDEVKKGQVIGEAKGFISAPIHASVSGKVIEISVKKDTALRDVTYIVIENDFKETAHKRTQLRPLEELDADTLKDIVWHSGNVGLGGAGFPTHAKLSIPEGKHVDTLIINGAECEPFLTADHRMMVEHPVDMIYGVQAFKKALGVDRAIFAIEDNKPDAIEAIEKAAEGKGVEVLVMKTKYPQGSEKQLIEVAVKRQVPSGGLPMDVGVVVINASSCVALAHELKSGMPLIERVVTVTGAVAHPKNLMVRIGTPIKDVLEYCGGMLPEAKRLVLGGPMMGLAVSDTNGVVTKTTSGILALTEKHIQIPKTQNCIRCGRCASVCPMHLEPMYITAAADREDWDKAEKYHAMDCMGCGSCSYVCPANRFLAQTIRVAKEVIAANRRKEAGK